MTPTNYQRGRAADATYAICVDGDPIPKGRPRLARNGHTYTPRRTQDYELVVGWEWRKAQHPCLVGPVAVTVSVFEAQHPADLDNYVKAALDALNGLAWADDGQVVEIRATVRREAPEPRMDIAVEVLS